MGFIGSVILGYESSDPQALQNPLFWYFWRSLIFWIPVFGKLIALGTFMVSLEFISNTLF